MRLLLIATTLIGLCFSACKETQPKKVIPKQPNILFIMSDDHAQAAISAYGSTLIQTDNIDRIAREGILFANSFVANSICAPSRATLLTGKFSHANGLRDNRDEFDGSQWTFPKVLQDSGYQTGIVGKWHLKTEPTGFDHYNILIGQGEYYQPRFIEDGDTATLQGYVTDLITDHALDFLAERDTSKPFCLLYHHKAPHRNWMPDLKHLDMYKDEDLPFPPTLFDDYEGRPAAEKADMRIADMYYAQDMKLMADSYEGTDPGTGGNLEFSKYSDRFWMNAYNRLTEEQKEAWDAHYGPINEEFKELSLEGQDLVKWMYQRYMKDYLRTVKSVDENIGRVLAYLDENGLAENTIVIYTSDQGFYLGEHGWYDKRFMYEESLRMPLVVRWPAVIEPGQVVNEMVQNIDFAPTFLDFAGAPAPKEVQGESLRPLFVDGKSDKWREDIYYHYYEYPHGWHMVLPHNGVRDDRYKLIHFKYEDEEYWELFDLEQDPQEMKNMYNDPALAEVQERLHKRLEELRTGYGDTEI